MHLVFANHFLLSSDVILYILPVVSVLVLFLAKVMFYKAPKLREQNKNFLT